MEFQRAVRLLDEIKNAFEVCDEVVHFETYEKGYYAIARSGARLDIVHAFPLQPPISSAENYFSFMFVETLQGFFLLRQQVLEGVIQHWEVYLEIAPEKPAGFFARVHSSWAEIDRFNRRSDNDVQAAE